MSLNRNQSRKLEINARTNRIKLSKNVRPILIDGLPTTPRTRIPGNVFIRPRKTGFFLAKNVNPQLFPRISPLMLQNKIFTYTQIYPHKIHLTTFNRMRLFLKRK